MSREWCSHFGMTDMRHTLSFDSIQQVLGETFTNDLTASVLMAARNAEASSNPIEHRKALLRLLAALSALIIATDEGGAENNLAQDLSDQTADLLTKMSAIVREGGNPVVVH